MKRNKIPDILYAVVIYDEDGNVWPVTMTGESKGDSPEWKGHVTPNKQWAESEAYGRRRYQKRVRVLEYKLNKEDKL